MDALKKIMIHSLFPTFIFQKQILPARNRLNKELLSEIKTLQKVDQSGQVWSAENYKNGFTTYGSYDQLHKMSSTFAELETKINISVKEFIKHLDMDISAKELQMTRCWANVMPLGAQHAMHIHPLSVISGTYYVSVPTQASALKIEDPRFNQFMASPPRKEKAKKANQRHIYIEPKERELVLFESWTKHEVPLNQSKAPRISVSFNYDWISY